ncbi:MAG: equilibrative nucleoside transporter [Amphiamblys sp. WSBS2006]|nr:MAG: equilibrative nucleoside transporter [Amphiamblys sp. WSBS2006]
MKKEDTKTMQKDRYNLLYVTFFAQGMANLIPWNCMLNSLKYFSTLETCSQETRKLLQQIPLVYTAAKILFMAMKPLFCLEKINTHAVLLSCIAGSALSLFSFILSGLFLSDTPLVVAMYLCAGLLAFFVAIAETKYYVLMALFHPKYAQSFSIGYGFSGVVTSTSELVTRYTEVKETYLLFYVVPSIATIVFAFLTYFYVFPRNQISKPIYKELAAGRNTRGETENTPPAKKASLFHVLCFAKYFVASFFMVVYFSFLFYPALLYAAEILNREPKYTELYTSIAALLFNFGNFVGKAVSSMKLFSCKNGKWLLLINVVRVVTLCPAYFLTIYSHKKAFPASMNTELLFYPLSFLYGFTLGHPITLAIMHTPSSLDSADPSQKRKLGIIMPFTFNGAILLAMLSTTFVKNTMERVV